MLAAYMSSSMSYLMQLCCIAVTLAIESDDGAFCGLSHDLCCNSYCMASDSQFDAAYRNARLDASIVMLGQKR